jgi:hypothetical protein
MVLLDATRHLVYPIGAVTPTGAKRGSARPDHGPHIGRTVPRCSVVRTDRLEWLARVALNVGDADPMLLLQGESAS